MDSVKLAEHIRLQFELDWQGIHGPSHWARVRAIGLELAEITGGDPVVVELFAWLHDSRRQNDDYDPEHGERAASFAAELRDELFEITDLQLALLQEACRGHSDGHLQADVTVQTCWDADRLDLGRVGITPDPELLCTEAARSPELRRLAEDRSDRWSDWSWRRGR
ncbi:MAG: hypothetical protein MK291_02415 [Planctomycetes bacterium]|nr:hypothetical protein [Planctomycetota bacterium]